MLELDKLFAEAEKLGITKRQIGLVCYGKNWRSIYKAKAQSIWIVKRNQKIAAAIEKLKKQQGEK